MDENRIAELEASQDIIDFASGVGIKSLLPAQNFIAPVLEVPALTGRFKQFSRDSRMVLPKTIRQLGSHAVQLSLEMNTKRFECVVNAADCPVDPIFAGADVTTDDVGYLVKDALSLLADVRSQVTELQTITTMVEAAGAGSPVIFSNSQTDPVKLIDAAILPLMKTAKSGSVAVLFDPLAWDLFKNNPKALEHSRGLLCWDQNPSLFHANARYMTGYSIYDTAPPGAAENVQFQLPENSVFIFSRSDTVSRQDPSFMKTFYFRPSKQKTSFRLVMSKDGRKLIVRNDWAIAPLVTNTVGVARLNVS